MGKIDIIDEVQKLVAELYKANYLYDSLKTKNKRNVLLERITVLTNMLQQITSFLSRSMFIKYNISLRDIETRSINKLSLIRRAVANSNGIIGNIYESIKNSSKHLILINSFSKKYGAICLDVIIDDYTFNLNASPVEFVLWFKFDRKNEGVEDGSTSS
jgi:hypothetical protein